jgi:hypothetical protein
MSTRAGAGACAFAVASLLGLAATVPPAAAKPLRRAADSFYFEISEVKLAEGIPAPVGDLAKATLAEAVSARKGIVIALPAGAPDPAAAPAEFARWAKGRKLRPYRVSVEVTEYGHDLEPLPAPRTGQRLTVRVVVRLLGEALPGRTMAFTGDGAATVKLEIGKRLRQTDSDVANHDSLLQALGEAVDSSLLKLRAPPPAKPARGKH